jgi:hypothetical protein
MRLTERHGQRLRRHRTLEAVSATVVAGSVRSASKALRGGTLMATLRHVTRPRAPGLCLEKRHLRIRHLIGPPHWYISLLKPMAHSLERQLSLLMALARRLDHRDPRHAEPLQPIEEVARIVFSRSPILLRLPERQHVEGDRTFVAVDERIEDEVADVLTRLTPYPRFLNAFTTLSITTAFVS